MRCKVCSIKRTYTIETTTEFSKLDLSPILIDSLNEAGFIKTSPIQELTLDSILAGKDVFAQAETGSGKTGAFVIPLIENFIRANKEDEKANTNLSYVVLSPTRELAQQTHKAFNDLGHKTQIKSACIIGGESIQKQKDLIGDGVTVLVATPGRLCDLIKQKTVSLANCKAIVFDEADRLFDMGFKKDIEFVLKVAPKSRQLIMLSATSNQDLLRTAYKFHSNPEELILNSENLLVDHIQHKVAMISGEEKFPLLVNMLRQKEDTYAIVFCNTQVQTHTVAEWLIKMGLKAKPISGRLSQNKRTQLLKDFRSKEVTILVCTDVAARGLDFKEVNLVVNYDLPQDAANYVHRIGRTGRAGAKGEAISFCAYEDCEYIDPIKELIETEIEQIHLEDDDFAKDICKKPRIDRKTLKLMDHSNQREKTRPNKQEKSQSKPVTPPVKNVIKSSSIKETLKSDSRVMQANSYDFNELIPSALKYFRIKDKSLLAYEVISEGGKKYIFFGPTKKEFKVFLKPIYKKLLLPFLINIIKKAQLKLYASVSFKENTLSVNFKGHDEKLLLNHKQELLRSFEQIITVFLQSRLILNKDLNIVVQCKGAKIDKRKEGQDFEKKLENLAKSKRKLLLDKKTPIKLKPLNPKERRIIHKFFQDDKEVKTESIGDGRFKSIQLTLK